MLAQLHNFVRIPEQLGRTFDLSQLQRLVPSGVDRAISDILQPVVERSVTIACMTSQELIVKVRRCLWWCPAYAFTDAN